MSTSIEAKIVELHLRHLTQKEIAAALRTGRNRTPDAFTNPINLTPFLQNRMETETLQTMSLSAVDLACEVAKQLDLAISRSTMNAVQVSASSPYAGIDRKPYCPPSRILSKNVIEVVCIAVVSFLGRVEGSFRGCERLNLISSGRGQSEGISVVDKVSAVLMVMIFSKPRRLRE
jgi:hypothetical protein